MDQHQLNRPFQALSTPLIADACVRLKLSSSDYLSRRAAEPDYTFRRHLREIGGAIEVQLKLADDSVVFEVADRGVGIPADELETVFDKFIQSSKTNTGAGGTGLGLAICKAIVEAHQGSIHAENRHGGGTVVVAAFPVAGPRQT